MRSALILAGGGIAGIAWETGILAGVADDRPDVASALLAADVLLGTSAGATVAAQIGSGESLDELFARQVSGPSNEIDPGVPVDSIAGLFATAMQTPGATKSQKLQRIGAFALAAKTVPEEVRRAVIAARLPSHTWPGREVRVTAIDIASGELTVFTATTGVELVDAVAASCAVPGAWPPVMIGDRRYMDGGVGSSVNMAAIQDCDSAVVLVPSAQRTQWSWGIGTAEEIEACPAATAAVFADAEALRAFGPNPLDPACRIPSAYAGRAQGRREADRIAAHLGF